VVCSLALGLPALAGKFLINPHSDQYLAGFAFRDFAAQSLKAGHGIPQWNPYLQGGLPYIAAMHGDIFYPTALMRWIMPTDVAMTWEFIIHLFLGGLFTYLFLRAWRFSFWAALVGGVAYMLGGSIAGFASPGHDGKLFVSTLMPAGLLLLTRGVRDGRVWAWGALAIVVGLAFLSPHPQLFQYFLILAGAFALFVALADHPVSGRLPRDVAVKRLAFALGAVVLGCLIGAIQYWPALIEYKAWSPRAGGHTWEEATSYSYPIEEVLNWYWPQFSGILDRYWGRNGIHFHSDYFGAVVLILAGAAFGGTPQRKFRNFWVATGIVSLLWAFGGFTPFYHLVFLIPYTKYLRAPSTMIFVTAFSVAVLAAIGLERVLARRVTAKYAIGWLVGAGAFAVLMSAGGYTAFVDMVGSSIANSGIYPPEAHSQVVDFIAQRAEPNRASAVLGVWRSFLFAALAAAVLWAFVTDRLKVRAAAIALIALTAVDLWSIERLYWIFSEPASTLFATDPAIDAIKRDIDATQPGRVLNAPFGSGLTPTDVAFTGDALMVHDLRLDAGYHGNQLGAYKTMTELDSGQVRFSPAFWRHENVQYFYTGADEAMMGQVAAQLKVAPFTKLAGPVRDAAGSMVYAYRIGVTNPPAWVASAMVTAPREQALSTVLDQRFDPRTAAIVDTSIHDITTTQLQALPAPATLNARVTSYAPGAIDVSLDQPATAGQALVVSENYFPGWHATADGKPAAVGLMNYNLVGVELPAGARTIQLRFTDQAYVKGARVTLVAALLALGVWIAGIMVDRRRVAGRVAA
jgi:hypothetical protein